MIKHKDLSATETRALIKNRVITLGGNSRLKIYGRLHCRSGKRLLRENRTFFVNAQDAKANGYRPCGHCMKTEYTIWKNNNEPF